MNPATFVDPVVVLPDNDLLTPALVIDEAVVECNIRNTVAILSNNPERWRPHVKTSKVPSTIDCFIRQGLTHFKCCTTRELLLLCDRGVGDVLFAHPARRRTAEQITELDREHPNVRISVLVEDGELDIWSKASVAGLFVDVNPGMDRTGMPIDEVGRIAALASRIVQTGMTFRGIHCYEGDLGHLDPAARRIAAQAIYDKLIALRNVLFQKGVAVGELVTSGTPAFPCAAEYAPFRDNRFVHRVSAGTVSYCDLTALAQLTHLPGYAPAAVVLSRVVSRPRETVVTCDAGHKTLSLDRGTPSCVVSSHSDIVPLTPSEEHLPLDVSRCPSALHVGDLIQLIPRNVCPTVNTFDHAVVMRNGHAYVECVAARGREAPFVTKGNQHLAATDEE